MQTTLRLVSTDFDGTLINHHEIPAFPARLGLLLAEFQKNGGAWVINTGRTLPHLIEGFELLGKTLRPDYVIVNEREIFWPEVGGGWRDVGDWNGICREDHLRLFRRCGPLFDMIHAFVEKETGAKLLYDGDHPGGLIAIDEEEMERIVGFLGGIRHREPLLYYQRNMIYLRFCHVHYSKGSALMHLREHLGISRQETFAAGDHFNDMSMLDGSVAGHVCCPSNAVVEVKDLVRQSRGHLAEGACGEGVFEALRRVLHAQVSA